MGRVLISCVAAASMAAGCGTSHETSTRPADFFGEVVSVDGDELIIQRWLGNIDGGRAGDDTTEQEIVMTVGPGRIVLSTGQQFILRPDTLGGAACHLFHGGTNPNEKTCFAAGATHPDGSVAWLETMVIERDDDDLFVLTAHRFGDRHAVIDFQGAEFQLPVRNDASISCGDDRGDGDTTPIDVPGPPLWFVWVTSDMEVAGIECQGRD